MVTKDYSKSRMRENCTYGSVRGGQSNLIPSTRLTAALPLRVVVGASKFIEGAGLYKTFTTALRARKCIPPFWWLAPPIQEHSRIDYEKTAFQIFIVPPLSRGKGVP